jgi:hypothetical protein
MIDWREALWQVLKRVGPYVSFIVTSSNHPIQSAPPGWVVIDFVLLFLWLNPFAKVCIKGSKWFENHCGKIETFIEMMAT